MEMVKQQLCILFLSSSGLARNRTIKIVAKDFAKAQKAVDYILNQGSKPPFFCRQSPPCETNDLVSASLCFTSSIPSVSHFPPGHIG